MNECTHRDSNGRATDADRAYDAGDSCDDCGCTLGADQYWYLDADQAPQ
jgi:hypothetical protein